MESSDVNNLKEMVIAARAGDLTAFAALVKRFEGMVLAEAYRRVQDVHLAKDAAQESFLQAYRDLVDLRAPEAFSSWLQRIVAKRCDRITRRHQLLTAPVEDAVETPDPAPTQPDSYHRRELRSRVMEAVQELPAPHRTATRLFYIDGLSEKQTAEFMAIPVSTLKKRLRDARKALRSRMMYLMEDD